MKTILNCYAEKNIFSEWYLNNIFHNLKKVFPIKKIQWNEYSENQILPAYSHNPRLIMTSKNISTKFNNQFFLDGVGLKENNIAIIKYQNSLNETFVLAIHELGHVFGANHCVSKNCVMGVDQVNKKYYWHAIKSHNLNKHNLFCNPCLKQLSYF